MSNVFVQSNASSSVSINSTNTEATNMIVTQLTAEEIAANIVAAKILKMKAFEAFDKFGISPVPMEWFTRGLIIVSNFMPGAPEPIGKVLLKKLVNAGINVKVVKLSPSKEKGKENEGILELVDCKMALGKKKVNRVVGEVAGLFPAATELEMGYLPIYGIVGRSTKVFYKGSEDSVLYGIPSVFDAMATHVADAIQSLPLIDRIEIAGSVAQKPLANAKARKKQPWNVIKVVPQNQRARSYGEAVFTFHDDHVCSVMTSRERWVNHSMDLCGKTYDGSTILCMLIMSMVSERLVSQRQIDGWLSALSNIWVREDNYGASLQYEDVLSFIIRNSHKTLQVGPTLADDKARYPHFALMNAKFNVDVAKQYLDKGIPAITDKYATERLMFGAGSRAMMIDSMTVAQARKELAGFPAWASENVVEDSTNLIIMPHDVAKGLAKLLNRPGQAFGANFADSWSDEFPLETTALRIYTSDEEPNAIFRGFKLNAVISNSLFGNGSGAASCHPSFSRPIAVGKKLSGSIHGIQFPAKWQQHLMEEAASNNSNDWIEQFIPTLEAKCSALVGQYFTYGQDVLTLFPDEAEYARTIIDMKDFNQSVKVTGFTITRLGTSETLQVVLDVVLEYADNGIKWRGPGAKATTIRENINFSDEVINGEWELFFPYESLKGRLLQVFMYANAMATEGYQSLFKRGKVYLVKGDEVIVSDLSVNSGTHFEEWVKANVKLVTVTREVAKSHYQRVLASNDGVLPHVTVIGDTCDEYGSKGTAGGVVIEEQVQVLYGVVHLQCEVSTPRENTGSQSMLLEGIAMTGAMDLMSGRAGYEDNLAQKLWSASADYRDGIVAAVNMALVVNEEAAIVGLDSFDILRKLIYTKKQVRTGKDLMRAVAHQFPNGIIIRTSGDSGVVDTYVDASAFLRLGSFGTGGTATGVALDVCELLHYMATPPEKRIVGFDSQINGLNSRVNAGLKSWLGMGVGQGTVNSKSVLKRLGRTNKVEVTLKIQTAFHPILENHCFVEGDQTLSIPTYLLHPECDSVKLSGVQEGDIVMVKRTPMVSPVFCRVKINAEHGLIGYGRMLPEAWAEGNEGDTDGDGCSFATTPADLSYFWATQYNASLFSQGGYWFVYGDEANQPFAEFVSVEDAWNKKILCNAEGLVPQSVLNHFKGKVKAPGAILQIKTADYVVDAAHKVSNHYSRWVGTVYGWCSMLSFKVAELAYSLAEDAFLLGIASAEEGGFGLSETDAKILANQIMVGDFRSLDEELMGQIIPRYNEMVHHLQASVLAWRYGYEGLGLGGYSEESTAFFECIDNATNGFSKAKGYVYNMTQMIGGKPHLATGVVYEDGETVIPAWKFLQTYFGLLQDKEPIVVNILVECEDTRKLFRSVERKGLVGKESNPKLAEAMMWAALRRTTQGTSFVPSSVDFSEDGGTSGFKYVMDNGLGLRNPILNDAMSVASSVHYHLAQLAAQRENEVQV